MKKHIKLFEEYIKGPENNGRGLSIPETFTTEEKIRDWLMDNDVNYNFSNKYIINDDGTVDLKGDFEIMNGVDYIQVKFNKVDGDFNLFRSSHLITLHNSPHRVIKHFVCSFSDLRTLKYAPREVNGNFECNYNELITLEHTPDYIGGDFRCYRNKNLITFGHKSKIKGRFEHDELQGSLNERWRRYLNYHDTLDEGDKKSSLQWLYDVDEDFHKLIAEYVIENNIDIVGLNKDIAKAASKYKDSGLF